MNRIVLIGNGFDLAHGLPTRYEDFIKDYWEEFMYYCIYQDRLNSYGEYKYDCIKLRFPNAGETLSQHLSDAEYPYRYPYKLAVDYNELKEFVAECNKQSIKVEFNINNKFLTHLLDLSNQNKTWVDIENEYYKFLCGTFVATTANQYQLYYINDLNPDFEHIKILFESYLIKTLKKRKIEKSDKIWNIINSDILLKDFTEKGQIDIANNECEKVRNEISGNRNVFNEQMSEKTKPKLNFYKGIDDQFLSEIILVELLNENNAKQYFDLKPKNDLVLNFNYTDTEKDYLDNIELNIETIHIHGELNNPDNPIIFGYGDELEENYSKLENLNNNAYLENIKSINYQETDNYKQMLNFINSDQYQVITLGHSCGNSDRTLLNTLFEHENCVSIKPYYYQYKDCLLYTSRRG